MSDRLQPTQCVGCFYIVIFFIHFFYERGCHKAAVFVKMADVIRRYFGIMRGAIEIKTGKPYNDYRNAYVGKPGLIIVEKSKIHNPGKLFIKFYPLAETAAGIPYIYSSSGNCIVDGNNKMLVSKHSKYSFTIDDSVMSDDEKAYLRKKVKASAV